MKEKPILFNTEMVKAIIDGRKTVTRRPIIIQPKNLLNGKDNFFSYREDSYNWMDEKEFICNFAPSQIGDHLYVRETAIYWRTSKGIDNVAAFKADGYELEDGEKWVPSIHMPKKYTRIWLEITDIRVERVRDITEDEALKEGIISNQDYEDNAGSEGLFNCPMCNGMQVHGCLGENMGVSETDCIICDSQKNRFGLLWDSLYDNWYVNPWVWVIEFKRIKHEMV